MHAVVVCLESYVNKGSDICVCVCESDILSAKGTAGLHRPVIHPQPVGLHRRQGAFLVMLRCRSTGAGHRHFLVLSCADTLAIGGV